MGEYSEARARLAPQMERSFRDCFAWFGIEGLLEELIHSTNNPEYKGSLRRCLQEVREEARRSQPRGILPAKIQTPPRRESSMAQQPQPRVTGKVRWFSEEKGYGFIEVQGQADIFVHHSGIQRPENTPEDARMNLDEGDDVEFSVLQGPKGPQADQVVVI